MQRTMSEVAPEMYKSHEYAVSIAAPDRKHSYMDSVDLHAMSTEVVPPPIP